MLPSGLGDFEPNEPLSAPDVGLLDDEADVEDAKVVAPTADAPAAAAPAKPKPAAAAAATTTAAKKDGAAAAAGKTDAAAAAAGAAPAKKKDDGKSVWDKFLNNPVTNLF
jgi:hypothetical protein